MLLCLQTLPSQLCSELAFDSRNSNRRLHARNAISKQENINYFFGNSCGSMHDSYSDNVCSYK